jgi:transcription elongation factor GreA
MTEPTYLTSEGLERIKEELKVLTGIRRKELAERLRAAIQMGDLSENADYHKAKEDQAFLEGRIQELQYLVRNAVVITNTRKGDRVGMGSKVTIQEGNHPQETYHLVGPKEADPRNGRISHESPIGRALMDRRVGDEVGVETPSGKVFFIIRKIE